MPQNSPRYILRLLLLTAGLSATTVSASLTSPSATAKSGIWLSLPTCAHPCAFDAGRTVRGCHVVANPGCICGASAQEIATAKQCVKDKCGTSVADLKNSQDWFQNLCKNGSGSGGKAQGASSSTTGAATTSPTSPSPAPIQSTGTGTPSHSPSVVTSSKSSLTGEIAGVVVGALAIVLVVAGIIVFVFRKKRNKEWKEKIGSGRSSVDYSAHNVENTAGNNSNGYLFSGEDYNRAGSTEVGSGGVIHEMSNETMQPVELPADNSSALSPVSPATASPNSEERIRRTSTNTEHRRERAREPEILQNQATAVELP